MRSDRRVAVVSGVIVALVLASRAPADIGPRDAGELTAAAYTLGVGHPTGAPLVMVLARLASYVPIGSVALRQGVLMALATGAAVAFALLAVERGRRSIAAAVVVSAAALAPTLFRAGTMTEVYAPSLALIAASWALVEARATVASFALGALVGLGAAAHVSARLLIPVALAGHLFAVGRGARKRAIVAALCGVSAFLPTILYVPAAASRVPALSWGDARNVRSFVRHFLASDIRESFATRTSGANLLADARALLEVTLLDLGFALLALAVAGLLLALVLAVRAREVDAKAVIALSVAADVAYSVAINPMGIVDRQVGHVALLGGAALASALVFEIEARSTLAARVVALAAFAAVLPRARLETLGDEAKMVPELWTVPGAMSRVAPRAIVVCDGDDSCGGALYAQLVEGARPDVTVVPRSFTEHPEKISPRLAWASFGIVRALRDRERALYVQGGAEPYPFHAPLAPEAPPLLRFGAPIDPGDEAVRATFAKLSSVCASGCTPLTRRLVAQATIGPIGPLIAARRFAEAEALATLGLVLDPTLAALWNDRAVARATAGRLEDAIADAERAVALDPSRTAPLANLVGWQALVGRAEAARSSLSQLEAQCRRCLSWRILSSALDVRDGAPRSTLDALERDALAKGKRDAWCRAYDIARTVRPPACAR